MKNLKGWFLFYSELDGFVKEGRIFEEFFVVYGNVRLFNNLKFVEFFNEFY